MNLTTNASDLKSSIAAVLPIVEKKCTIPVLSGVKFSKRKIVATDLDMQATVSVAGKMKGETVVTAHRFAAMVRQVPGDEEISLAEKDGQLAARFNGAEYGFYTYPAGDFPKFSTVDEGPSAKTELGNSNFLEALNAVRFAVSTEETRYYLNGVALMRDASGNPVAVATDGHRMAVKPLAFEIENGTTKIIHSKTVDYLISRGVNPTSCTFAEDRCVARFEYPGLVLDTKLIDATYPDFTRVIPNPEKANVFTFNRAEWLRVLRRILSVDDERGRAVKLSFDGTGKGTFTSQVAGEFFAEEKADVIEQGLLEPTFKIGLNCRFLVEILKAFEGCETVSAKVKHAGSPLLFTSPDTDFYVVQMPSRV